MKTLLLLLFPGLLTAQQIIGVTSTQAVIQYTAPSASACEVEVSESPTYAPLHPDLIASDLARSSTLVSGLARTVTIGQRTGALALAQSTAYHVRACGTITFTIITTATPMGDTSPMVPPFDSGRPGNWGFPGAELAAGSAVDPLTGVRLTRSEPKGNLSWRHSSTQAFRGATLANLGSGSAGSTASLTTTAQVVHFPSLTTDGVRDDGPWLRWAIEDIGLYAFAGASSATTADRQFTACLSVDSGATCYTNTITSTAAQGAVTQQIVPSSWPSTTPGFTPTIERKYLPTAGTLSVSGTTATIASLTATQHFPSSMILPAKVYIAGSSPTCASNICTITAYTSESSVTLAESLTLTNVAYSMANLAVRVAKANATGTLDISFGFRVAARTYIASLAEVPSCNTLQLTLQGKVGNLCMLQRYGVQGAIFFLPADGSAAWPVSLGRNPNLGGSAIDGANGAIESLAARMLNWSTSDARTFFFSATTSLAAKYSVFSARYNGDGTPLDYAFSGGVGGGFPSSPADVIAVTNLTPPSTNRDIDAQVNALGVGYDAAKFGTWAAKAKSVPGSSLAGKYAVLYNLYCDVQDGCPGWIAFVDIETGNVVRALHGLDYRCALHAIGAWQEPQGVAFLSCNHLDRNINTRRNGGPFHSQAATGKKLIGGTWSANTSLPPTYDGTYDGACPTISTYWTNRGAVGNKCVKLRMPVGGMCNIAAPTAEAAESPCSWNASYSQTFSLRSGDTAGEDADVFGNPALDTDAEKFALLQRNAIDGSTEEWVLLRWQSREYCSETGLAPGQKTHANGFIFRSMPTGPMTCGSALALIDVATNTNYWLPRAYGVAHLETGKSLTGGAGFGFVSDGVVVPDTTLSALAASSAGGLFKATTFAGFSSTQLVQGYPKVMQSAPAPWIMDAHALNPSAGTGAESIAAGYCTTAAPTLQGGTTSVYKVAACGNADAKRSVLVGWSGYTLLGEKSSPTLGNTLTDADTWRFCHAYRDGECRVGSVAGELFVVVPRASTGTVCYTGVSWLNRPCLTWQSPRGGFAVRRSAASEVAGEGAQRLTGWMGGSAWPYWAWLPASGGVAIGASSSWIDGRDQFAISAALPPFRHDSQALARTGFIPIQVTVPAGSVIEFGYNTQFHCTARAEACKVSAATITQSAPFSFSHEALSGSAGTTISIPAIAGRVLYFRVGTGPTQVLVP